MERVPLTDLVPIPFSEGRSSMALTEKSIHSDLKPFIQRLFVAQLSEHPLILLPGAHCLFVFSLTGKTDVICIEDIGKEKVKSYQSACLLGPRERWLKVRSSQAGEYLFVVFYPGAFYKLLKKPCSSFQNKGVNAIDLCASTFGPIRELLIASPEPDQAIQEFLLRYSLRCDPGCETSSLFDRLVDVIIQAEDSASIADLCALLHINQKRAERIFQRYLGLNPKSFQKIRRYLQAQEQLFAGNQDYRAIASHCGYHDLPHMIRNFKSITGLTPAKSAMNYSQAFDCVLPIPV